MSEPEGIRLDDLMNNGANGSADAPLQSKTSIDAEEIPPSIEQEQPDVEMQEKDRTPGITVECLPNSTRRPKHSSTAVFPIDQIITGPHEGVLSTDTYSCSVPPPTQSIPGEQTPIHETEHRTRRALQCCARLCLKGWIALVGLIIAFRAIIVRMGFVCFTCVAIMTVVTIKDDKRYLLLGITIIPLMVDLIIAIRNRIEGTTSGKSVAKWFSVCNFAYLICACPPMWMIELHNMDVLNKEVKMLSITTTTTTPTPTTTTPFWLPTLHKKVPENESLMIMGFNIEDYIQSEDFSAPERVKRIPRSLVQFEPRQLKDLLSQKIRLFQQLFLLSVIVGRWLMPREGLTRDQLSQLLLINIGTAADILELLEAFNEQEVRQNYFLRTIILCLWQASLLQFCFNKTATKRTATQRSRDSFASAKTSSVKQLDTESIHSQSRKISNRKGNSRVEVPPASDSEDLNEVDPEEPTSKCPCASIYRYFCRERPCLCCETELWAIGLSLILQDVPFLCLRLVLIFGFNVRSAANVFFTCKNTLLIMLQVFRSGVIITESYSKRNEAHHMEAFQMYSRRYRI